MRSMFNGPGIYLIRVAGRLDARRAERLGGLRIAAQVEGDEAPNTELTGYLADQAALYGVLNTLYDYHYPLLYVEYLGPAESLGLAEDRGAGAD